MGTKSETAASLKQQCKSLEAALLTARGGDGSYASAAAEAYQLSRDIRHVANSLGYPLLGTIAANLCRIFEAAQKAQIRCPQDILDCHFEALRLAQTSDYSRRKPADFPQLVMGLLQTVQIVKSTAARMSASAQTEP